MEVETTTKTQEKDISNVEKKTESLADRFLARAIKQVQTSDNYQKPIFDRILKNEEMLLGKEKKALKGRNNVPLDTVIMNGFLDTLLSNQDEPINISYKKTREQDLKAAQKITAVWDQQKVPSRGNFDAYVLDSKYFAASSGRGFLKMWVESRPKFAAKMSCEDHFDMITEPMGGPNLDKHLWKGQRNIFRSTSYCAKMAKDGTYDEGQVKKLKAAYTATDFKRNKDDYKHKMKRLAAMGTDIEMNDFVGENLYSFIEFAAIFDGKWYYMVFEEYAKVWVRFEELDKVFAHAEEYPGRAAWVSYATHRHPKIFWSKAILDDVRPIAYTMKKVLNLSLDNLEKRNWDMKAYNPKVFRDPTQLLYKQDGLAQATLERNQSIQSGIYQFTTPDTTDITINLNEYLDRFLSTKTGISPELQNKGDSDSTNGIYFGNVEQAQNRIGLKNRMFYQAMHDIGTIFDWGCYEHLDEKFAVKILGPNGVQWEEEVTRGDLERDFIVEVTGGNDAERQNALLQQRKAAALERIGKNPKLQEKLNSNWLLREELSAGGYDDEAIRIALDTQSDGNEEILSEAAESIAMIVEGRGDPLLNRGATTGFVSKIIDYAYNNFPLATPEQLMKMSKEKRAKYDKDTETLQKLLTYGEQHIEIAQENMLRNARMEIASRGGNFVDLDAEGADARAKSLTDLPLRRNTPPVGGENVPARNPTRPTPQPLQVTR